MAKIKQWFLKKWKKNFLPSKHSDFYWKSIEESIFFGPMALQLTVFSEFGLFHSNYPYFFTFLTKKVITFEIFLKQIWEIVFYQNTVILIVNWVRNPISMVPWFYKKLFFQNLDFFMEQSKGDILQQHWCWKIQKNFFSHQNIVILIVNRSRNPFFMVPWLYNKPFFQNLDFFHSHWPYFFTFFYQKIYNFSDFWKKFEKKLFCLKQWFWQ